MKIEITNPAKIMTVQALNMLPGQIGKVCGVSSNLYLLCLPISTNFSDIPARFMKIWPNESNFEFVKTVPDSWNAIILPEGTIIKLTSN
jgi:hypothetical protein